MILETFPVGPLQCNCTILGDEESDEAIVVDPGDEVSRIARRLRELGLKLKQILRHPRPHRPRGRRAPAETSHRRSHLLQ